MKYRILREEGSFEEMGGPSEDCWSDFGSVDADDARAAIKQAASGRPGRYVAIDDDAWTYHTAKETVEVE